MPLFIGQVGWVFSHHFYVGYHKVTKKSPIGRSINSILFPLPFISRSGTLSILHPINSKQLLSLVLFGYSFNLTLILLLIGIPFVEAWSILLLIHTNISVETLAFLVYHILKVERCSSTEGFTLFLRERQSTEFARNTTLFQSLFLGLGFALLQTLLSTEDKLDTLLLGIDLDRSIEGLSVLGSHPFHFHRLTLYKVFVLLVRERYALNLFGDRHLVGTQSKYFVRLRVDGNVSREWFSVLRGNFYGLTEIACGKQGLFLFCRKLVPHIGEVQLWLFAQGMHRQPNVAVFVRSEDQASFGLDGAFSNWNSNGKQITLLPREHFVQFSPLFQLLLGETERFQELPVNLFEIDGRRILLLRKEVLEAYLRRLQLLFYSQELLCFGAQF